METDPTELPIGNEATAETFSEASAFEASEDPFVTAEDLARAPEILQESVKEMEAFSESLTLNITKYPLDAVVAEQAAMLGLSEHETADVLVSGGYAEKDAALRDKAQALYATFRARLAQAAKVGVAAIAIGASTPAVADASAVERGVTLQMAQTLEEKKIPRTYEEAKEQLKESTLAPAESFAFLVRKQGDEVFTPTILKRGTSNTVPLTDEDREKMSEAMESNTSDIEMVHTHPINDFSEDVGGLNDEDIEILRRGGIPRVAMSPSPVDLEGLAAQLSKYPPAQLSGRVIDPSGEWEYGIADSSAPFIAGVRKTYAEMDQIKGVEFTPEEREYVKKLNLENIHPGLLQQEISSRIGSDPLAQTVLQKMNMVASQMGAIAAKNINLSDNSKFNEFEGGWSPWMHPGTPEGDAEIARREKIAAELGFRMKYTPNPITPKVENIHDGVMLRSSEMIDSARLDQLGSEYPYIDKYGNKLDPNKDSSSDIVTEEEGK
ncbi:MAG: hypothetical protein A2494_02760 [Candidatus Lloydbacteria bacterium RIFOXYC12_FULL_46_25]|uniref:Uncharacterized protein n=1 Tax=Candidatus Lloydbacteria bacterium RIFOXYC12_FULL_46_25 TaxID=1798670 RepID=A0A1G2DZW0_9BACT|nr:MAG: hypothetical protein A2494_02760 [Candidatus Lloydbacteria bacterium RIFOXYC12_FULL_46_25]